MCAMWVERCCLKSERTCRQKYPERASTECLVSEEICFYGPNIPHQRVFKQNNFYSAFTRHP